MSIITKIFGTYSDRQIKKLYPIVDKIEALEPKYQAMTDGELSSQTEVLKSRLSKGETLDDILPDAFAAVREASWRVLGKKHYRVQLLGGIVIHQGRIAEMKTGEGKTLMATLPAYLNALSGEGVHIVTVNDYLAKRDSEWMGSVYKFMGLSVGLIVHGLDKAERQKAYNSDITYGTNNEFGFDYLRDNMVIYKRNMVQRTHAFAIVDEVDSILIDEARTPLIISGPGEESDPLYEKADDFAKHLRVFKIKELDSKEEHDSIDADYIVDEKANTAVLTASGIEKAEKFFGIENLADVENASIMHHINQAIRARGVMKRDVDYVVKDGEVLIVDSFTGRIMYGRRYSNGLHQAIEAKEGVKIERENKTQATITYQNFFRLYKKLSGMTGTALTEEEEFREIYGLDVVEIPTNKPMIRNDRNDVVYTTVAGKYKAIIKQIAECHEKGQPVLVGTVSIEKSELLSALLTKNGIKHTVLNAKHHEKEAEIVAQAGKLGAVTISTNMAGRGTDIVLGGNSDYLAKNKLRAEGFDEATIYEATGFARSEDGAVIEAREKYNQYVAEFEKETKAEAVKVCEAGGLYILGTERHESRRIDNQLRGRAGRQGDPGESRFFLSMEDDLMRLFGTDRLMGLISRTGMDEDTPIDVKILSNSIENAQKRLEGANFDRRKHVLQYDDVMNRHREIIYKQRREVLDGNDIKQTIINMMHEYIKNVLDANIQGDVPDHWNFDAIRGEFYGLLCGDDDFKYTAEELNYLTRESLENTLIERADKRYAEQEEIFRQAEIFKDRPEFGDEPFREIERIVLLENVDRHWVNYIDDMDDLISGIGLRSYAQHNPITEYRLEGGNMFEQMITDIKEATVKKLLSVRPAQKPIERKQVLKAGEAALKGEVQMKKTVIKRKTEKVGPNDPCPCGSGKKYKKCCMGNSDNE
ncbi:MAG: preprotein translocase subunit SecA [Clostridia bacterium]|nr:preprotein translocase subunit SecA [Clostridia bacterium]